MQDIDLRKYHFIVIFPFYFLNFLKESTANINLKKILVYLLNTTIIKAKII